MCLSTTSRFGTISHRYASKEVHRIKLGKESGHKRNANLIVNLLAFEDAGEGKSDDFDRVIDKIKKLDPLLDGTTGEVWAKDSATAAAAAGKLSGAYKAFPAPGPHAEAGGNNAEAAWSGYSQHDCDCTPTPALTPRPPRRLDPLFRYAEGRGWSAPWASA